MVLTSLELDPDTKSRSTLIDKPFSAAKKYQFLCSVTVILVGFYANILYRTLISTMLDNLKLNPLDMVILMMGTFVPPSGTGAFTLGLVIAWSSPSLGQIEKDQYFAGITDDELSWIASLFPIGALFSGSLAGFLLKRIGERKSMILLCIPSVIAWLLIAFATNLPMFYVGRFILGLCNGAQPLLIPIYVSHIADDSIRGLATAPFPILCTLGLLFVYIFGTFLSWTALTGTCAIFPAIFCVLLFFIPESPSYLISKGEKEKAGKVLLKLHKKKKFEDIQDKLVEIERQEETIKLSKVKIANFIAPAVLKPVLMILAVMAFQQFSGLNCILFFAGRIFESAKTGIDSGLSAIIMTIFNLIFGIIFMLLVDKLGRKLMLLSSCIGCAISLAGVGIFFYMQESKADTSRVTWLPLVSVVLFTIFFCTGLGPVPWILMAEVLPSKMIGSTSALSVTFNWALAFILTKSFDSVVSLIGASGCFWTFGAICVVGAFFTAFFVPETKGRTLQDIQVLFTGKTYGSTANE